MNRKLLIGAAGIGALILIMRAAAAEGQGNIVVTQFYVDKTTCTTIPCTVHGTIGWKNQGSSPESFTPSIKVNGVVEAIDTVKTLQPNGVFATSFQKILNANATLCPGG